MGKTTKRCEKIALFKKKKHCAKTENKSAVQQSNLTNAIKTILQQLSFHITSKRYNTNFAKPVPNERITYGTHP